MASGITSPLGIFALVLLIIGIIMAIIGIIFIIARQNQTKDWWIWTLLIGGLVMAIFGGILLAVAMATYEPVVVVTPDVHHHGHHHAVPVPAPMCPPVVVPQPHHHHGHHGYPAPVYPAPAPVCGVARPPAYAYQTAAPTYYPAAPVPTAVAPRLTYYPRAAPAPAPAPMNYAQVHTVGTDSLDPDPQMYTERYQPAPRRVTANGPYGPNGENATVGATFTPAAREVDHVYDIPNHPVQVVGAGGYGAGYGAGYGYPAQVGYAAA